MKTETPRTDAIEPYCVRYDLETKEIKGEYVPSDFARTLELELNAALKANSILRSAMYDIQENDINDGGIAEKALTLSSLDEKGHMAAMPDIAVGCNPRISSSPDVQPDGPCIAHTQIKCQTNEAAPMSGYAVPSRAAGGEEKKL